MIWPTILLAAFFVGYVPGTNCGLLSVVPESAVLSVLKKTLPFDPTIGLNIYKSLQDVEENYAKIRNHSLLLEIGQSAKERFSTKSLNEGDISFHLYNPKKKTHEPFSLQNISNANGKLFFIVHGWVEDIENTKWLMGVAASLVTSFDKSQVILVDWGSSSNSHYPLAAGRTKAVGQYIAKRLIELVDKNGINPENIVLIGYDLGAHVCGIAGESFREGTKKTLPQIIGLDPSGLSFEGVQSSQRLDETDASVVMVVHTDNTWFGYKSDCGTIDFYPNGGNSQPGCELSNLLCSHRRSYDLFMSAISSPKKFPTLRCADYEAYQNQTCKDNGVFFGDLSETKPGKYYFTTTDTSPFYKTFNLLNPFNLG